jgi:hypothetical protein
MPQYQTEPKPSKDGYKQLSTEFKCSGGEVVGNKTLKTEGGDIYWSYSCVKPQGCGTKKHTLAIDTQYGAKMFAPLFSRMDEVDPGMNEVDCRAGQVVMDSKVEKSSGNSLSLRYKCCDKSVLYAHCTSKKRTKFREDHEPYTPVNLVDPELVCDPGDHVTDVKLIRGWLKLAESNGCDVNSGDFCGSSSIAHEFRCCTPHTEVRSGSGSGSGYSPYYSPGSGSGSGDGEDEWIDGLTNQQSLGILAAIALVVVAQS